MTVFAAKCRISIGWIASLILLVSVAAYGAEKPADVASGILDTSGVQGGLVVHLGCGDGRLTVALRASDRFVVHGLDHDAANVEKARAHIRDAGVYGPVSADRFTGRVLPYTNNLINLLVAEDLGPVPMDEVQRVLVPNGVALIKKDGEWVKTVKPRPDQMDEWTHYLHDTDGNAVSHDRLVDFPRQFQWLGGPRYSRQHDHMSAASAMVTAGGRLFAIFDHASPFSIQLPSRFQLVARDAFNGTVLWRRDVGPWFSQLQKLKSGPADLLRRLVAIDNTVYATLALDAPVTALDAATGKIQKTYEETKGTDEILCSDGTLFFVVNRHGYSRGPFYEWTPQERTIMAVATDTGKTLWEKSWPWIVPGCLAVAQNRVVFFDGARVVALDLRRIQQPGIAYRTDRDRLGPRPAHR